MSGSNLRRGGRDSLPLRDYSEPNHGPTRSRELDLPTTPIRSPQGPITIPTVVQGDRAAPTNLQSFAGRSVVPFMRWAFPVHEDDGRPRPNHDYNPELDNAVWLSETIDWFDSDERLIHELILCIADPDLGHPVMNRIRENRAMVQLLIYRHFKKYGGIIMPPMAPARAVLEQYQRTVHDARQAYGEATGRRLMPGDPQWPRITFPPWVRPQ